MVGRLSGAEDYATHLARYLTVRSAGLIEAVRDDVADQHCRAVAPQRPHRRVATGLRTGLGARPDQLVSFVQSFDVAWAEELAEWMDEDESKRKNLVSGLVGARKKIAHGDGAGVSVRQAIEWAEISIDLAKWLVKRFDPR